MTEFKLIIITIALSVSTVIVNKYTDYHGATGEICSITIGVISVLTAIFGIMAFVKITGIW